MDELQHDQSAWHKKADFVIAAKIEDEVWSEEYSHEQLMAKKLGPNLYKVCSIPFALYNINLDDKVSLDEEFNIKRVIERGNYCSFRIATKDSDQQHAILKLLNQKYAVEQETFSDQLTAVAVPRKIANEVSGTLLNAEEEKNIIAYETLAS
jgi:hypothetical protein